jgi:23S rRNA (uracil1939-C5)-methyltransferase
VDPGIEAARGGVAAVPARKPRAGDEIDVRVTGFDARGRAVGTSGAFRVRLRRGVEGELLRARVLRRRKDVLDAVAGERLEASPLAVPPRCVHFGSCGGCSFQDLDYAAQLLGKRKLVGAAFAAVPLVRGASIDAVLPAPEIFAYRNKMEFAFGSRRWMDPGEPAGTPSSFALGLHAANLFSKVIDIRACAIQSRAADAVLDAARAIAVEHGLTPWDVHAHAGLLRHLVVRVARNTGEMLVSVVTSEDGPAALEAIDSFGRALLARPLGITTLVHGVNSRPADTAMTERERVVFGPGFIREELAGLVFALSAGSFFQTNTLAAELLVKLVREEAALLGSERVWDLYCGTGTLALALASSAREVVGFEISPSAVADARRNAELNAIANARFVLGDVIEGIADARTAVAPPDVLLLDPPRSGLHPRLFESLFALAARRIVYVSCNPTAAAKDAARFVEAGWRLARVRPVDLFPHTPHVECVLGLSRDG